ncbi:MAG: dTMP kinase [Candidatus Berkelbacteria bacterium]|nr:dTMP kinase [Candidatus Berkelbacteria bacterium]
MTKSQGMFIAIEGLDGSGTSTQADLLVNNLNKLKRTAFLTKEPTNNLIGGLIRGTLTKDWQASPECLQLLFAADRAHHLDRMIIPALLKDKTIVTDRYIFSTIAFGSVQCDKIWLEEINRRFLLPDITFFIDVPASKCIKRIKNTRNQFELFEREKVLAEVRENYLALAKNKKQRIKNTRLL